MGIESSFLITGSTGFIGSFLAHRLLMRGGSPLLLARSSGGMGARERAMRALSKVENALGVKVEASRVRVVEGDMLLPNMGLSRKDYGTAASRAGAVIHTAASLSFNDAHAEEVRRCNRDGTKEVVGFCHETGASLHHVSTAYVCGICKGEIPETYIETPPVFRNEYERSKWESERIVLEAARTHGLRASIYRPSIVLGDRSRGYTSVFSTLYRFFYALDLLAKQEARRAGNGEPVNLNMRFPVDPEGVMSIVPIDYVADALLHIAGRERPDGRIFHLVTRNIPKNVDHLKLVLGALNIEGISLLSSRVLSQEEMTVREKRILNAVSEYTSYFDSRIEFLDDNTRYALRGSDIDAPRVDQAYVERIIHYARESKWGRIVPGPEAEAPEGELASAKAFFTRHLLSFEGKKILPELKRLDATFGVTLTDPRGVSFVVHIEDTRITKVKEDANGQPVDFSFCVPVKTFLDIVAGREDPREAFFAGKTDIQGDLESALAIIPILKRFFEEYPYDGPVD